MADTKKYVSLAKLSLYDEKLKKYLADADAATLKSAKDYADGLASNYDASGAAAGALAEAKSYADGLASNYDAAGAAAGALAEAKSYADGKDAAIQAAANAASAAAGAAATAQGEVDALETYVGTIPEGVTATSIVGYIQEKTSGIASEGAMNELSGRVTAVEGDVATIKGDYLKAADKTELQGNIDTVAGAVERLTNGVSADEIDGVNELIQYVKDHGPEVTGMKDDISENAEAIEGVAGRMTTAEGKITALEEAGTGIVERIGAVEDALEKAATDVETAIEAALETAKSDASDKDAVVLAEAQKAASAVQTALDTHVNNAEIHVTAADKAKWDAAGDVTGKAHEHSNFTVLEGITSDKVTAWDGAEQAAKTYADGLNSAMDTRVTAIETWHANFVEVSEAEINALFA